MTVVIEARLTTGEVQALREFAAERRLSASFHVGPEQGCHVDVQVELRHDEDARAVVQALRKRQRLQRQVLRALAAEPGPRPPEG